MNIEPLLIQSLQLLGLGMGAVFIILISLIGIITLVSRLVPPPAVPTPSPSPASGPKAVLNSEHIVALSAAIHLHRKRR